MTTDIDSVLRPAKISPVPDAVPQEAMAKSDYVQLAKFRYAVRRFLEFSQKNAEANGLTPQQHQALLSIRSFPDRDEITIGELAEHLCIRQNSAVELAARLGALGLVTRRQSDEDRRRVLLRLTPTAEQALAAMSANNLQELRRLAPSFAALITSLTADNDKG